MTPPETAAEDLARLIKEPDQQRAAMEARIEAMAGLTAEVKELYPRGIQIVSRARADMIDRYGPTIGADEVAQMIDFTVSELDATAAERVEAEQRIADDLAKIEEAGPAESTIPELINRGAVLHADPTIPITTAEQLRQIALFLSDDGRPTPRVIKDVVRANAKIPEADRLTSDKVIGLVEEAAAEIATIHRAAIAKRAAEQAAEKKQKKAAKDAATAERKRAEETKQEKIEALNLEAKFLYMGRWGPTIDAAAVAKYLHDTLKTVSFNGTLYIYQDGVYRENKGQIQREIKTIVGEAENREMLTRLNREVLAHLLATEPYASVPFNQARDVIPVANGVIRIDYETGTIERLPHSPDYRFTYSLPVNYDPDAMPAMAEELFGQYVLAEDVPLLVQPFAQALLQAQLDKTYKKNYLLQGNKNAGKSTYTEILKRFFGDDNISRVPLQGLGDRFCNARMENKLVNYYDDLSYATLEQSGKFKTLTGTTAHDIERKFAQTYSGRIFCPHVFTCNRPPRVADSVKNDDAWWERWEYVRFPFAFAVDPLFEDRVLTPEFNSSLLAAAIKMMIEIRQRGALTINRTSAEVQERWSLMADPVYQFINAKMERLQATISDFDKGKLFGAYLEWCKETKIAQPLRIATPTAFTLDLQGYGLHAMETSTTIDGRKVKYDVYRGGYRWKDPDVDMGNDFMAGRKRG